MISHGKNIKIFSGNSHPALAMQIASALGLPIGKAAISLTAKSRFPFRNPFAARTCSSYSPPAVR